MSLHCEERTYAQSYRTAIEDEDHVHRNQDAVFRMHQIKMLAGELFARHIHRCLDSKGEMPLPQFTRIIVLSPWTRLPFCGPMLPCHLILKWLNSNFQDYDA